MSDNNKGFFEDDTTDKTIGFESSDVSESRIDSTGEFFEDDFYIPPPVTDADDIQGVPVVETVSDFSAEEKAKEEVKAKPAVSDRKSKKKKPKKKKAKASAKNWIITIVWVLAVLCISVTLSIFALRSMNDLVGFSKESHEIQVTIPEGSSLSDIADILKEKGVIDEPFAFEVYATIKKKADMLSSGTFTLNSNLGYDQIFQVMKIVDTNTVETVTLTFYEGMKATEIAKKLAENGVCDYDEFMKLVDTAELEYDFVDQMSANSYVYHKWEGYLFPDTYEFYVGASPKSVLTKFVDNFSNKISAYYDRMSEMGLKLSDAMALASVIQSEAGLKEDMCNVSSVFHNRLVPGSGFGYLQSDVTYFYYRDEIEPYVTDKALDTEYHTSYDTYYKSGYPVGPICNPGLDAIEAALYPADTGYYYFVTDLEGNFYYARTLEEHEINTANAGRSGGMPEGDQ